MKYQILYKGEKTNYPLYDSEEQARAAMLSEGMDEDKFHDTWTSPRGIELITQIVPVEEGVDFMLEKWLRSGMIILVDSLSDAMSQVALVRDCHKKTRISILRMNGQWMVKII